MITFLSAFFLNYKKYFIGAGILGALILSLYIFHIYKIDAIRDEAKLEQDNYWRKTLAEASESTHTTTSTTFTPQQPTFNVVPAKKLAQVEKKYQDSIQALIAFYNARDLNKDSIIAAQLQPKEAVIPDTTVELLKVMYMPIENQFYAYVQLKPVRVDTIKIERIKWLPPPPDEWCETKTAYTVYGSTGTIVIIYLVKTFVLK
jgi:hypothetical protein